MDDARARELRMQFSGFEPAQNAKTERIQLP
jgi:hypothetical protein